MMRSTHSMSVRLLHADPGQLAHQRRAADHLGEQPGHLEVEAVLGVEQASGSAAARGPSPSQRLVRARSAAMRPVS